jgi:hypothetical protein
MRPKLDECTSDAVFRHFAASVGPGRLTVPIDEACIGKANVMEDKSLFISSCSRRELARRRPGRNAPRARLLLALVVLVLAAAAVFVARGGV